LARKKPQLATTAEGAGGTPKKFLDPAKIATPTGGFPHGKGQKSADVPPRDKARIWEAIEKCKGKKVKGTQGPAF